MASLTRRTLILIVCRTLNFGVIMLLSPMIMVRIFDVTAYGQYREFVLYYVLISGIASFSVMTSLIYFIPKYPEREHQSVTQTALMLLILGSVGAFGTWVLRDLILAHTSYDFILPLVIHVFLLINLDYYESYSLGRKRSEIVLYYSTARAVLRLAAIVVVAAITRDVMKVIWTLVVIEAAKCIFVLAATGRHFSLRLDRDLLRKQLRYIVPLGTATTLTRTNIQLSKLVISATMGAENLALYTIGAYQVPLINIVRSSIMDVLFPEMTRVDEEERITLWKRATVVFCFIVFPVFSAFFWYAETVIETLFTWKYLAAVPLFRVYLLLMILQCFDMTSPLRAINRNTYFIIGSAMNLAANLLLILALFGSLGIMAPAIAFIASEVVSICYLSGRVMAIYHLGIRQLVMWRKILLITVTCLICTPVLLAGNLVAIHPALRAVIFSILYLVIYVRAAGYLRIEEIDMIISKLRRLFTKR